MNKVCKVIWSHVRAQMVVVSEVVSARGKTHSVRSASGDTARAAAGVLPPASVLAASLALAMGMLAAGSAAADVLPAGGQVVAGQASISTVGSTLRIDQDSQRAAINWQSFNVGAGAQVHFNQPGAQASTLNRVLGAEASTILGQITAPGQVIISNGNGVFFGRGSVVDVGSLIATTHAISNEQFMSGVLRFERQGATGSVINEGELRARIEGFVALIAPEVRNQGLIVARKGTVALAAGELVELQLNSQDKLVSIGVEASQWQALVDNRQAIEVDGGLVIMSAMAVRDFQGGVVRHSGSINASSMTEVGGRVLLVGDNITLKSGSTIDARGVTGGGQVLVGGDWQGGANAERRVFADPDALHQATTVTMEAGASIDASATGSGNGGTVVLWSDVRKAESLTSVSGTLLAQGGQLGGDGGQIETSGYRLAVNGATVSTNAVSGKLGDWLLDPTDVTLAATGSIDGSTITVNTDTIQTSLVANNVIVQSSGDLSVDGAITASGVGGLRLTATNGLSINANINIGGAIELAGTDITIGGALQSATTGAVAMSAVASNNLTVSANQAWTSKNYLFSAGNNLTINADMRVEQTGTLTLRYGQATSTGSGATYTVTGNMRIPLPGASSALSWRVGSAGTDQGLVFNNGWLGFYAGGQVNALTSSALLSLTATGQLQQPHYYSGSGWYKLTYSSYPLDLEVGVGEGGARWNGNTTFYSGGSVSSGYVDISGYKPGVGTGSGAGVKASGTLITVATTSIGGAGVEITNRYSLGGSDKYLRADTSVKATSSSGLTNVGLWVGTRDDWVGGTDGPIKKVGNIDNTGFTQNASPGLAASALKLEESTNSSAASVLFYSTDASAVATYASCCSFSNATTVNPWSSTGAAYTSAGSTTYQSDGSYALYTGLGNLSQNQSKGFTWFYAAAPNSEINSVAGAVASSLTSYTFGLPSVRVSYSGSGYNIADLTSSGVKLNTSDRGQVSLLYGTDYDLVYSGNVVNVTDTSFRNAGTYRFAIALKGTYAAEGYTLSSSGAATLVIEPKALTVTGTTVADKTYDGTTNAVWTLGTVSGYANDERLNVSVSGAFSSKNVGTYNLTPTYTLSDLAAQAGVHSGGLARNYSLSSSGTVSATINKANLVLTGTKVYDASTAVYGSQLTANGVGSEKFSLTGTGATGNISAADVGSYTLANLTGLSLGSSSTGGLAANYNALTVSGSQLTVTPKPLTVSGLIASKEYDGGVQVSLTGQAALSGGATSGSDGKIHGSDAVSLQGTAQAVYQSAAVGTGKSLTLSGLTLIGAGASNYSISPTITGEILKKTLQILGVQVNTRVYDGSTALTFNTSAASLSGRVGSETVTYTLAGHYADKNVGAGKSVIMDSITLGGGNAGNYRVAPLSLTGEVTRLSSVTWVGGGATNNWFDPRNWAGGAVPDLSNVQTVSIPTGTTVRFDPTAAVSPADGSGAVNLVGLGTAGSLVFNSGSLNVGAGGVTLSSLEQLGGQLSSSGAMTVGRLDQTGGSMIANGDLSVSTSFNQGSSGSIKVYGQTRITDTSGGAVIGNLRSAGLLTINSTGGALTQAANTLIFADNGSVLNASQNSSPADILLGNAGNEFKLGVTSSGRTVSVAGDVKAIEEAKAKAAAVAAAAAAAAAASSSAAANSASELPILQKGGIQSASANQNMAANANVNANAAATATAAVASPAANVIAARDAGVKLSVIAPLAQGSASLIAVTVPSAQDKQARGGFEFSLPKEYVQLSAATGGVQVALKNGEPLPNWLKYDEVAGKFTAQSVPPGSFPLEVKVMIGAQETSIVVTEDNVPK